MDDLTLLGRNENDLKSEMKIVQTVSKDVNMNFGLEKCARICLKRGSVQSKMRIGSTFENDINVLEPTGYVTHQQFNVQQLYALPTLYLCVLYLSENKQRLVPLTA